MTSVLLEGSEAKEKDLRTEAEEPVRRICFVCTGNTCRSPMAAAVANALANQPLQKLPESIRLLSSPELEACCAGLHACDGEPIAANAVLALESAGVPSVAGHDYHTHTAHTLCEEEAERYDQIVGMTKEHAFALMMRFPRLVKRITVLPVEIADPYGGDAETYRKCLEQITRAVQALLFPEQKHG